MEAVAVAEAGFAEAAWNSTTPVILPHIRTCKFTLVVKKIDLLKKDKKDRLKICAKQWKIFSQCRQRDVIGQ